MTESDELLLERWRQKDQTAFDLLFLRHYGHVYRVLYPLVGSREEAEDLAQETFLALHDRPPRPSSAGVGAWLRRVALNAGYNAVRAANRTRRRLERCAAEEPNAPADPQAELLRAEERARVRDALARLPRRQAEILLLRQAGASYAEIAAVLQVAPGSVGTLLARAGQAFLKAYEGIEPAPGPQRRGAAGDMRSLL
jgi:RNA polymerase sigma-70 factor (ECF subfamily)